MPFYEYECPACKYYLEVLQKISDKPLKKCPSCGKPGFKRLISAPVFRLKGSGWYETDFKGDKDNKRTLAGSDREESKSTADDKPAAKADGKPDAKADAKPVASAGAEAAKPAAEKPKAEGAAARNGKPGNGGASRSAAKRGARPAAKARAKVAKRGARRR